MFPFPGSGDRQAAPAASQHPSLYGRACERTNHQSESLRPETGSALSTEGRSGMEALCVSEFQLLMDLYVLVNMFRNILSWVSMPVGSLNTVTSIALYRCHVQGSVCV